MLSQERPEILNRSLDKGRKGKSNLLQCNPAAKRCSVLQNMYASIGCLCFLRGLRAEVSKGSVMIIHQYILRSHYESCRLS